ncbi:hypothetical protein ACHAWT_009633 [Skeletonema menzelii]
MMQQHRYYFLALATFSIAITTTILGFFTTTISAEEIVVDAVVEKYDMATNKSTQNDEADKNIAYDGSDLIEWITSNGGFIHPNTRIGLDPTGQYRGVFVKSVGGEEGGTEEGIEEDELVATIPWDLIVKPNNYDYHGYISPNCDALHEMYHQFQLGDKSKYAPYINYLINQPAGRIPSEWSKHGKELLSKIMKDLPPYNDALHRYERDWIGQCHGEDTPLARQSYFQLTSRDEDGLMVPFYDMHNHSNDPKRLNTVPHKPKKEGRPFTMRAIRDIAPGEQIIISYNRCHPCWFDTKYDDCETRSHGGTDFLFSQFGFVEDHPQFWYIPQYNEEDGLLFDEIRFCLDKDDETGQFVVTRFGDNYSDEEEEIPFDENLEFLKGELDRLLQLEHDLKNDGELMKSMPSYEWDMTWTYQKALVKALKTAIETVEEIFSSGDRNMRRSSEDDDVSSSDDESRDPAHDREDDYDDLEDDSSDDGDVSRNDEL